eukprot:Trichotokara_eunicae@DN5396_c0_g1_i4.p1
MCAHRSVRFLIYFAQLCVISTAAISVCDAIRPSRENLALKTLRKVAPRSLLLALHDHFSHTLPPVEKGLRGRGLLSSGDADQQHLADLYANDDFREALKTAHGEQLKAHVFGQLIYEKFVKDAVEAGEREAQNAAQIAEKLAVPTEAERRKSLERVIAGQMGQDANSWLLEAQKLSVSSHLPLALG